MKVQFFCPVWGIADWPPDQMITRIKAAGYDGIEFGFPFNDPRRAAFMELTKQAGLLTIGQLYNADEPAFAQHTESYRRQMEYLISFQPLFINAHTGRDHYSFEQNLSLIDLAARMQQESGIPVMHETHRGRFPFCINATLPYLRQRPALQLVADLSHFCTVSESYLQDQQESLQEVLTHAHHIHARVGHPQGPQVTDPRLPEWQAALEHHLQWWDTIVQFHRNRQTAMLTITPEFGPAPYMPAAPFTQAPLASQWDINVYMMDLLRIRYQ